jgi:hypothetical protein
VLVNLDSGMDVDIEILESKVGQLGKFKSKLRVRVTKEKLLVTVHDGKFSKGWKVQVAGRQLLKPLINGVEQESALEIENTVTIQTIRVKSIELNWKE